MAFRNTTTELKRVFMVQGPALLRFSCGASHLNLGLLIGLLMLLCHVSEVWADSFDEKDKFKFELDLKAQMQRGCMSFPKELQQTGKTGAVLLEYSISPEGRTKDVLVLEFSGDDFSTFASEYVEKCIKFKIPPKWSDDGSLSQRKKIQILYNLTGYPPVEPIQNVPFIVVTGNLYGKH